MMRGGASLNCDEKRTKRSQQLPGEFNISTCNTWPSFADELEIMTENSEDLEALVLPGLRSLFGDAAPLVVSELRGCLETEYGGDLDVFLQEFFQPCLVLLQQLQEAEGEYLADDACAESGHDFRHWPLCYRGSVLVHAAAPPAQDLSPQDGDFLLCVSGVRGAGPPCLVLRWWWSRAPQECPLTPSTWPPRMTMEWLRRVQIASAPDLGPVLRQCLACTERGVARLTWPDPLPYHPPSPYPSPSSSGSPASTPRSAAPTPASTPTLTPSSTPGPSCEASPVSSRVSCQDPSGGPLPPQPRGGEALHSQTLPPCDASEYSSDSQDPDKDTFHDAKGFPEELPPSRAMTDPGGAGGGDVTGAGGVTDGSANAGGSLSGAGGSSGGAGGNKGGSGGRAGGHVESADCGKARRVSSGSGYYTSRMMDTPASVLDVDYDLLQSGVAVLPGSQDVEGRALVFLFTGSTIWHTRQISSTDLTRLLLYYHSVPRHEISCQGLTVVADVRGATSSIVNTLLECLYLFDDNIPGGLAMVHLLADRSTQSLVLKSPVYHPQSSFKLDLLLSQELLYQFVQVDMLPSALDGNFPYCHEEWVRFRIKLEPFLSTCRGVAVFLVEVMGELSRHTSLPRTAAETVAQISQHEEKVKSAFDEPGLISLQRDGEMVMSSLRRGEAANRHSPDYRYAMEMVDALFQQLQDTMTRLLHLAETRLAKLEQCLQLREFEEECNKLLTWLGAEGRAGLHRHREVGDNLKAVSQQQRDFDKFYFASMKHIEKGNDLLEEASMLSQSGQYEDAPGYRDLARTLKVHLQRFTSQLEETREKIEGTAQCYHLLDKSYEWALEAMKYVASMKMEHVATSAGLDKLLRSLEAYLAQHPPLREEQFAAMLATASRLGNDRLMEQCRVAQARCQETSQLLLLRQSTLRRAKEQLRSESQRATTPDRRAGDSVGGRDGGPAGDGGSQGTPGPCEGPARPESPDLRPVWEPRTAATPGFVSPRPEGLGSRVPRHYASSDGGKGAGRREGRLTPTSASDSGLGPARCEGLGRVLSPPTSPAHSPMSPSVTDLVPSPSAGSDESCLSGKSDQAMMSPPSGDSASSLPISRTISQPGSTYSSHNRPIKKLLKRAVTAPVGTPIYEGQEAGGAADARGFVSPGRQQRDSRTLSMLTGSSESLPSMPEEEDEESGEGARGEGEGLRTEWTPVPVNSHLYDPDQSLAPSPNPDPHLSQAEVKSRRTQQLIISEMIATERDYVRALQYIIENYIPEFLREDVPQALRGKRNVIFGNLEKIYQFHSAYFLREVESCQHSPFSVGQFFLLHDSQFYLYALYNKNKPKSDFLLAEYGKFFQVKQCELGDRMDLASYLLKPVQRMGKYNLLLKQLLKECPESHVDFPDLKAAEEMVRFQLRHGNDLLAMDALRECDVNLPEQGRLLRQDEFLVMQGRKKCMRRIFLFEDLVLFSKTRRGRQGHNDIYVYKSSFKTADIGLTENYGGSGYKFEIWFRRRSLGENYILQAPNSDTKRAWVREISKLLWKQAVRNRELRLTEMATMGIGYKPCLDLKPSEDNIQDRFVNVNLGTRGARMRNSIAVSSFEHLRNGNKRPHSIISVSSTSSSNSSHSSLGLFGSLNLAFDPLDSPRLAQRRSIAVLSNESGIGTDMSMMEGDTTGCRGGEKRPENERSHKSTARSYIDYMKSRVLKTQFGEQVVTDV